MKTLEIIVKLVCCVLLLVVNSVLLLVIVALFADITQNASIREFYVSEPEDSIVLVEWRVWWDDAACVLDFGDGTQTEVDDCYTRRAMFHTYEKPGGYLVTLRVYGSESALDALHGEPDNTRTLPLRVPRAKGCTAVAWTCPSPETRPRRL